MTHRNNRRVAVAQEEPRLLVIRDDLGQPWTFDGQRIKMIGDDAPDGGYQCASWEDGIRFLNEQGYITPEREELQ